MSTTENGIVQSLLPDGQERSTLVEFKGGKIIFKQKPMLFDKQSETLQEIVAFRTMLEEQLRMQQPPLVTFPEEHKPLIAKLGHESDKTLGSLTKYIHHELLPTLDEDDESIASIVASTLPLSTVEAAIRVVLTRRNYGVEAPDGVKLSNALCIWRWEVQAQYMDWLPKNCRERAEARQAERIQAREDIKGLLQTMSEEERSVLLDHKKTTKKLPAKQLNCPEATTSEMKSEGSKQSPESSKKQGKRREDGENEEGSVAKASLRTKKAQDLERAAKDKEKQEKKTARQEKERKEKDAQNKSQSLMSMFFTKPKAQPIHQDVAAPGPSNSQSDFERVFKPFVLGKEKTLAPQNWFHDQRLRKRRASKLGQRADVIVIDAEEESDVQMIEPQATEEELRAMIPLDRLHASLSRLEIKTPSVSRRHQDLFGFKIHNKNTVRDMMSHLTEAEISGNDDLVRELSVKLHDRDFLPAKVFCFHTDKRPGYFGTWTRSSKVIGPRRPLIQDTLAFDYAYDSGEEWEEEPVGEDVVDDGEDEDGDVEEGDSDMDDWLVDDVDEPDLAAVPRASSPPPIPIIDLAASSPPKRKADNGERRQNNKKRKVVVPLVPFAKGPVWERVIGQPEFEPFNPYTIKLFNDSPCPIDPFAFVSNCVEDYKAYLRNVPGNTVSNEGVFVVPTLPSRAPPNNLLPVPPHPITGRKPFPDMHISVVVNKINQLHASSLPALVEAIYQDLREHKVTKIAIESKVREIGEKCREKRFWIVKPDSQVMAS